MVILVQICFYKYALLYPQAKVGDILDSGPSCRRGRNFFVYAITQKWISIFFQTWYTCKGWPEEDP